jgi:hypothetical protein
MARARIQLPDDLYDQARRLAEQKEISFSEVVRRGLEHILRIHPPRGKLSSWKLDPPANTQLRSNPFANPYWRAETNMRPGSAELTNRNARRKSR